MNIKSKLDLVIERIIKNKFKNLEIAKKNKKISTFLMNKNLSDLSKKEKEVFIQILLS